LLLKYDKRRSNKGFAGVSEFILALSIIFVGLVPPIIDLSGLAVAYGVTQLVARRTAARAANATSFNDALNEMQTEALALNNTSLAQFCKLQPTGGYAGCGVDLYINETNIYTNKTTTYGPNATVPAADPSSNIYQCTTQVNYSVTPLISMSLIPFFSSIEGVGQPFPLGTAWNVAIEHPQLLDQNTTAYAQGSLPGLKSGGGWTETSPVIGGSGMSTFGATPPVVTSGPLTSWNFVSTGTYAPSPGQTQSGSSPYTFSMTDQFFDTNIQLVAGQRISLQMLTVGGPGRVFGTINGVSFEMPTNTLDFLVPVSGDLTFTPEVSEGWTAGTNYNLEVIVTN
jgi:hypothetical protein